MQRTLVALLVLLAASATLGFAESNDALVTFYSAGSALGLSFPGYKAAFEGAIFDGNTRLALMRHDRFLTVHLSPGSHSFSASYSGKHPAKNSQLSLDLTANGRYFVRVEAENTGIFSVKLPKGRLEQVTCATAQAEAGQMKPSDQKQVAANIQPSVDATTSLPSCD